MRPTRRKTPYDRPRAARTRSGGCPACPRRSDRRPCWARAAPGAPTRRARAPPRRRRPRRRCRGGRQSPPTPPSRSPSHLMHKQRRRPRSCRGRTRPPCGATRGAPAGGRARHLIHQSSRGRRRPARVTGPAAWSRASRASRTCRPPGASFRIGATATLFLPLQYVPPSAPGGSRPRRRRAESRGTARSRRSSRARACNRRRGAASPGGPLRCYAWRVWGRRRS